MTFYLGSHKPHWLGIVDVPLCVSHRTLRRRKTLPRAKQPWLLDSGGFSELSLHGRWTVKPGTYLRSVRRYVSEIGSVAWAAVQDWMCEPFILEKTGLTIAEHQWRTVRSYLILRDAAPELPWLAVLQGWEPDDYRRHADMYAPYVDLERLDLIGLGSVCRRQHTGTVELLIRALQPLKLHGFGFKLEGLTRVSHLLASSDSMAWSFDARRKPALPGCSHKSCANCARFALQWRERLVQRCAGRQLEFLC